MFINLIFARIKLKKMNRILRYILITVGIVGIILILWLLRSILLYILIAGIVSLLGHPLVEVLLKIKYKRFKFPRSLAAGLTIGLIYFLIYLFLSFFIPKIGSQFQELSKINGQRVVENLREPIQKVDQFVIKYHLQPDSNFSTQEYLKTHLSPLLQISYISDVFTSFAGTLGDIIVAIFSVTFISFFFLKDKGIFFEYFLLLFPINYVENVRHIFTTINRFLVRYFIGLIIDVLFVMTLNIIGLNIIGLEFSSTLVIGLITGITNVIPYVGPIIGALLGLLIAIATHLNLDFYSQLLPLLALMGVVFSCTQVLDSTMFQPFIYSNSVKAHPLEIFLVILCAGTFFGIPGMVVAIPSYTIIRVIAREFFNSYRLVKKLTANLGN
jgi:predicted PurR-regulated permease PerM